MTRLPDPGAAYRAEVVSSAEHVRRRPSMYVGSVDAAGIHWMLRSVIDILLDDTYLGLSNRIDVTIRAAGGFRITSDGHDCPRQQLDRYFPETAPNARHGITIGAVAALSDSFAAEVRQGGAARAERYLRGVLQTRESRQRKARSVRYHVEFEFYPDPTIFPRPDLNINAELIEFWFCQLAFLLPKTRFRILDERSRPSRRKVFASQAGITEYVAALHQPDSFIRSRGITDRRLHVSFPKIVENRQPVHSRIFFADCVDGENRFEMALQWTDADDPLLLTYANWFAVMSSGPHQEGLRRALRRTIVKYGREYGVLRAEKINHLDCIAGLTLVLAMKVAEPMFQGATQERLHNPETRAPIYREVVTRFSMFLECYPGDATTICTRVVRAHESRMKQRRGRKRAEE